MKSEKLRLYTIELTLIMFLLLAMIYNNIFTRPIIAVILLVFMIGSLILIKTTKKKLINSKQITILLSAFGFIYVVTLYIIGVFVGFYNATVKLSLWSLLNYIIPYTVIIISSEIIRKTILLKDHKIVSKIITIIAMAILDMILWTNIYNLKTVKDYFTLISFIIFSSVAHNMLYNYIMLKYRNYIAIIIYRLITTLYMYIFPIAPDIYIFFECIIRIIVPYIIYIILESMYGKKHYIVSVKQRRREIISTIILAVLVTIIVMLVSCKFKYGLLTIGSGSMTGTINKGDVILYEQYEPEDEVKTGEIVVFMDGDLRIVHRVIDQKNMGEEIRYYTKGDANMQEDDGYRERTEIVGRVKFRIPYIGNMTLWLNNMVEK